MISFVLFLFMKSPIGRKIAADLDGPELQQCLSAFQTPSDSGYFHPVFDEMATGSFNDPCGYRIASPQIFVIMQMGGMVEKIFGTCVYWFPGGFLQLPIRRGPPHGGSHQAAFSLKNLT